MFLKRFINDQLKRFINVCGETFSEKRFVNVIKMFDSKRFLVNVLTTFYKRPVQNVL